jgi:dTMP kinase
MKGCFVVLEGVDGAGTTTQAARLAAALRSQGRSVRVTREPSDGPIGSLIRLVLTGRLANPGWQAMALLFAADRMDHLNAEILPFLESGGVVISDRYDASSLAYQSVSSGEDTVDWIRALNSYARRPDLVLVLSVPAETAEARRNARGGAEELYEKRELQRALAKFYVELSTHMPADTIEILDGTQTADEVTRALLARVLRVL